MMKVMKDREMWRFNLQLRHWQTFTEKRVMKKDIFLCTLRGKFPYPNQSCNFKVFSKILLGKRKVQTWSRVVVEVYFKASEVQNHN